MLRLAPGSKHIYPHLLAGLPKVERQYVRLDRARLEVKVDATRRSRSGNFTALQGIAGDKGRVAYLYFVRARTPLRVNIAFERQGRIVVWSFREWYRLTSTDKKPLDYYVDANEGGGSTHFSIIGNLIPDTLYSPTRYTEVYIANNGTAMMTTKIIYHELRGHVYPGKLGRNILAGSHGDPHVEIEWRAAEAEATINAQQ